MAKVKKTAIDRLAPNAITVAVNGESIRVASNKEEHQLMSMLLAARLNHVINKTLDDYKNDEIKLTPRELKDLAGAARDIATFGAEVYGAAEPPKIGEKPTEAPSEDISFDALSNPPEVKEDTKNEQTT